MRHRRRRDVHLWLCAIGLALAGASATSRAGTPFDVSRAISEDRLDLMRGGFDLGSGVMVGFGLERKVEINGQLITSTRFHIQDLSRITPEQAQRASAALAASSLVRNGIVQASPAAGGNGAVSVIQNSLNDQTIRNITTLNVTSSSLGMVQTLNSLATLRDALAGSLRP